MSLVYGETKTHKKETNIGSLRTSLNSPFVHLEHAEDLLHTGGLIGSGHVLNDVEANSLGKRTALANGDQITLTNIDKARGAVDSHVGMSLLESAVLRDILQIISADNDGSLHLGGDNHSL